MKKLYLLFVVSLLKYSALTYLRIDLIQQGCMDVFLFYKWHEILDRTYLSGL